MSPKETGSQRWLQIVAIVAGVLVLAMAATVFLVLTGIIAEPETVIENIVRMLLGQQRVLDADVAACLTTVCTATPSSDVVIFQRTPSPAAPGARLLCISPDRAPHRRRRAMKKVCLIA